MGPKKRVIVFGAGGFAREVRWLIEEIGSTSEALEFAGYAVSDLSLLGEHDSRDEVLGDLRWLEQNRARFDFLALGIGAPASRLRVADQLVAAFGEQTFPSLVHPSVRYDRRTCRFGPGSLVCAGVTATVNVILEPFALINLHCTLGHEAVIGRASVLNPSVNVSGGVRIGPGVLVGTGAQILQYLEVGAGATIGAGAVVVKPVGSGETVVGIPAKALGQRRAS